MVQQGVHSQSVLESCTLSNMITSTYATSALWNMVYGTIRPPYLLIAWNFAKFSSTRALALPVNYYLTHLHVLFHRLRFLSYTCVPDSTPQNMTSRVGLPGCCLNSQLQ